MKKYGFGVDVGGTTIKMGFFETYLGKIIISMAVSMVPVIELRGGVPIAVGMGIELPVAFIVCIIGNMIPVPFILLFLRKILTIMEKWGGIFGKTARWLRERAEKKGKALERGLILGLIILVAVPLPGTGAWTGTLAASFLNMGIKSTALSVSLGVVIAGIIMALASTGVFSIFGL
jgi:uncharacterized membrane protein